MKIIFKISILLLLSLIFFFSYLTFIGLETKKFNNQIVNKLKNIDPNLKIELKEVKITLEPMKLRLKTKTIAPKLKNNDKTLEIENINANIPIKSLFNQNFLIENLEISTKSLKIADFISFIRTFNHDPKLYLFQKLIEKGYLIADIKINFDEKGNFKNDFKVNGFVKDAKISVFKKYEVKKLNFIFNYKKNNLSIEDLNFSLNNLNFLSKKLNIKNLKDKYLVDGEIDNKDFDIKDNNIDIFIKPFFPNINIETIELSSNNKFSFEINKEYKFNNFNFTSDIEVDSLIIQNDMKLQKFFPKIKKKINFSNHKIKVQYKKKYLKINGIGDVLLQNKNDVVEYSIEERDNKFDFKTFYTLKENPFLINFLNYEKKLDNELIIKVEGNKLADNGIRFNLISLNDQNNQFKVNDLLISKKSKIINLKEAYFDYFDINNYQNKFNITSKKDIYYLNGASFNVSKLIDNIIDNKKSKTNFIDKNFNLNIAIDELFLDKNHSLKNFEGNLSINNQEIINGNLIGYFSDNKKLKFTVRSKEKEKVTTLLLDNAKAIVSRYKFVKGFDEGILDFNSSNINGESISKLKIYDFKLKELPALTKLLTLASLQGIADLLSGEGIRFDEFEMNFKNKDNLMTIDEIYAIGPAISILMNGYVEKNKLVSLRGTLVPATTINKVIGSIPIVGQILVGSKTGEGVFGVSFKIKGSPKNLETSVNPIKTLTPRFITRTLEKIKKN